MDAFAVQCAEDGYAEIPEQEQFWVVAQYALKTKDGTSRDRYLEEKAKDALISHLAWRGLGIVDRSRVLRRQAQHLLPHPGRQQGRQRHQGLHPRRGPGLHQAEHRRRAVRRGHRSSSSTHRSRPTASRSRHHLQGAGHGSHQFGGNRLKGNAMTRKSSQPGSTPLPRGPGGAGPQVARARGGGNPRTPGAAWPAPACRDARASARGPSPSSRMPWTSTGWNCPPGDGGAAGPPAPGHGQAAGRARYRLNP